MTQERKLLLHKGRKIPQTSNLQLAYSSMMSKTAVQKKTDYRSSLRGLRRPLGGGGLAPLKPKHSYVPDYKDHYHTVNTCSNMRVYLQSPTHSLTGQGEG